MSFEIKQRDEKWLLGVRREVWEFPSQKEMQDVLNALLKYKENYGRITRREDVEIPKPEEDEVDEE